METKIDGDSFKLDKEITEKEITELENSIDKLITELENTENKLASFKKLILIFSLIGTLPFIGIHIVDLVLKLKVLLVDNETKLMISNIKYFQNIIIMIIFVTLSAKSAKNSKEASNKITNISEKVKQLFASVKKKILQLTAK